MTARHLFQIRAARILHLAAAVFLLLLSSLSPALAQPKFPPLTGRVVDEAGLLSQADREALTRDLAALESKSTDQLVVVTLKSLQGYEISDYGFRLGRAWGIGQGQRKDNGVLLIVVPSERKVRIEVGRGLEPVLTDALTRLIIENRILPAFRRNDFPAGILAGAKDIQDTLLGDAEGVKERARGAKRAPQAQPVDWITLAFWVLILSIFLYSFWQQARAARNLPADYRQGLPDKRRREQRWGRSRDDGWIIIPGSGGGWGGGGGWSGGGDGDSGGGFSGGGGDFGGGGSSGSW